MNRLDDFGRLATKARQEGIAFEAVNAMEKGQKEPPPPSPEDEIMQMPQFLEQADEIAKNSRKIEQFTDELEKQHKKSLATVNPDESMECSSTIDVITAKINQISNKNRALLKDMEFTNEQLKDVAPPGSGHMRMREIKHRQLATSFLKATKRLQKMQTQYREKYRQQLERQYKLVNPKATPEEIAAVTNDEGGARQKIFATAAKDDAKKTLSQMKDRYQDVKLMEKSILELHQLFLDLQTLVVQQGDIINRVDYNVDKTVSYTETSAQELVQAVEYQKGIWKKKWILMMICIIVFAVIMIFLLVQFAPTILSMWAIFS